MRGSVIKRGRGWRLKFDVDPHADGRRQTRYITFFGSKKAAQAELTRLLNEVNTGVIVNPDKVTLGQYLKDYLDGRHDLQPTSLQAYRDIFTRLAAPIAHIQLQKLKPAHVKAWLDGIRRHGGKNGKSLGAVSVRHAHRALSAALQAAVELELLSRNVCAVAKPPAAEVTEVDILGPQEIKAVREALKGGELYFVVCLALATGCRRGELCGLRWRDVDFAKSCIKIEHSMESTSLRLKEPKSRNGKRTITLSTSAVSMLHEHRRQALERRIRFGLGKLTDEDFVFSDHQGRPIPPNSLSVMWRKATRPLGLDVKFHSLRHSHASALVAAGIDPITVSRRLGHASAAFTLHCYGHLFDKTDAGAAAAVDGLLK